MAAMNHRQETALLNPCARAQQTVSGKYHKMLFIGDGHVLSTILTVNK